MQIHTEHSPRPLDYAAFFLVMLATMMFEILLTRIFSVTMWYHFAFMAISIAMFGMTTGALIVYLLPHRFPAGKAKVQCGMSALLFAVTSIAALWFHVHVPFIPRRSAAALIVVGSTFAAIAVPFVMSGICTCLALTRFPRFTGKLYATDLAGAACGCLCAAALLSMVNAPAAIALAALIAGLGGVIFCRCARKQLRTGALIVCLPIASIAAAEILQPGSPLLRVAVAKGKHEPPSLWERWNSYSRVKVWGNPDSLSAPFGWGFSARMPPAAIRQLHMNIDAAAYTPITNFSGDWKQLDFLRYDLSNLALSIRPGGDMLVIGVGGGRDILSALLMGTRSVTGVEINSAILRAISGPFADFSGNLAAHPKVTLVNGEARSWVARQRRQFDVMQISLIDTWAATAAGAFVLSENSLYTIEAWKVFLQHLTTNGVLTVTRWYYDRQPAEALRAAALAAASLRACGVSSPRGHIIAVRSLRRDYANFSPDGVATILLSPSPFSDSDIDSIEAVASHLDFRILLSPRYAETPEYSAVCDPQQAAALTARFPLDISPPNDNRPFFFHMLRMQDMFNHQRWQQGAMTFNAVAVSVLGSLLVTVIVLTGLCVFIPLLLTRRRASLKDASWLLVFFCAIGLGFMLIEIAQMQRLTVFLGHPVLGLSVFLVALLLSSGAGSYLTHFLQEKHTAAILFALSCLLAALHFATPVVTHLFQSSPTFLRAAVAAAMLVPPGLCMGMPFAMGMRSAAARAPSLTAWLWGINGSASVLASVAAMALSLTQGISFTFYAGIFCYAVAGVAALIAGRSAPVHSDTRHLAA